MGTGSHLFSLLMNGGISTRTHAHLKQRVDCRLRRVLPLFALQLEGEVSKK